MSDMTQPWSPTSNTVDIKVMGKLLEELGELTAALSRCLIQGINASEPVTGKPNIEWLMEEVADVRAGIELLSERFFLVEYLMKERIVRKKLQLREWHGMKCLGDKE